MIDAAGRLLPDFLIVGAMRGGTNSLGRRLGEHPEISIARRELHFFDRDERFELGPDHYSSCFALAERQRICGERTPAYSDPTRPGIAPPIPQRIAALLPDVKLLWCLRDPVERAWSHHWHEVDRGRTRERFERVLEREERSGPRRFPLYLERGLYALQIRAFLERTPLAQMHFVLSETLFAQPDETLRGVHAFLGVEPDWIGSRIPGERESSKRVARFGSLDRLAASTGRRRLARRLQRLNKRLASRPREPMRSDTRVRLAAFFAPHNRDLEQLTGLDLGAWSRAAADEIPVAYRAAGPFVERR